MIAVLPSMTLPEGYKGTPSTHGLCETASLRLWLNLPRPPASQHITLGFYYSPESQHTDSHVNAGHKLLRLAVPFLPKHSVQLMPIVSTQLPNRSLALPLSFYLHSSSLILAPSMA